MLKKFSIAVIAVVVVALIIGLLLPRSWRVERSIVIADKPERIAPYVIDLRRWQDWSVWTKAFDPLLRNTYEGPSDGVGARWLWLGPKMGRGRIEIVAADPLRGIELDQAIESDVVNSHGTIAFSVEGDGTRVTWVDTGELPPLGGLFRGEVEATLGKNFDEGLTKLKALVEALPRPVEVPPQPPVVLDAGVDAPDAGAP